MCLHSTLCIHQHVQCTCKYTLHSAHCTLSNIFYNMQISINQYIIQWRSKGGGDRGSPPRAAKSRMRWKIWEGERDLRGESFSRVEKFLWGGKTLQNGVGKKSRERWKIEASKKGRQKFFWGEQIRISRGQQIEDLPRAADP